MENGGRKWRLGGPNGLEFHGIPCLLLSIPIEGSRERETGKARSGGETGGASKIDAARLANVLLGRFLAR